MSQAKHSRAGVVLYLSVLPNFLLFPLWRPAMAQLMLLAALPAFFLNWGLLRWASTWADPGRFRWGYPTVLFLYALQTLLQLRLLLQSAFDVVGLQSFLPLLLLAAAWLLPCAKREELHALASILGTLACLCGLVLFLSAFRLMGVSGLGFAADAAQPWAEFLRALLSQLLLFPELLLAADPRLGWSKRQGPGLAAGLAATVCAVSLFLESILGVQWTQNALPLYGAARQGSLLIFDRLEVLQLLLWIMLLLFRLSLLLTLSARGEKKSRPVLAAAALAYLGLWAALPVEPGSVGRLVLLAAGLTALAAWRGGAGACPTKGSNAQQS